jgi:tRNA pseudouridine55 synthase
MDVPEILLVDKPKGITSFDVIRRLRRELGIKKMGHAGTLDPLATGLMIIGVQGGTKKLTEHIKLPKEYIAEVLIGERRSTGDMEGVVLEEKVVSNLEEPSVRKALSEMLGILTLPVSAYSAIKKDGVPMYKRARKAEAKGEMVEDVPVRDMEVKEAELNSLVCEGGRCVATIRFAVGSGTYIRSLAEELGKRLGYPATLQNLRRTKIGNFKIEDARKLQDEPINMYLK